MKSHLQIIFTFLSYEMDYHCSVVMQDLCGYLHSEIRRSSCGHRIVNIVSLWFKLIDCMRIHMFSMHKKFQKDNSRTFGEIADKVFAFRHNMFVQ